MAKDHPRTEADPGAAALFDFVSDFLDDLDRGGPVKLVSYLERYPGYENIVAREYL
ncbi:MAG: hypothetical protein ACI841_001425, partial [Planctomycetota bacterium]